MIDLKLLSQDFDAVASKLEKKRVDTTLLESLKTHNQALKEAKVAYETAQAQQNSMSKLFGEYKREGKDTVALKEAVDANKLKINELLETQRSAEEALLTLASSIPNLPDEDVPHGEDESSNIELKKVLTKPHFDFAPKEHWELGQNNQWIDFERGVKLAKSRFSVLQNDAARIERALINYMLDFNAARGFAEMSLPYIVNEAALYGTGQLPKFAEDLYRIEGESLYLIPTAEVPLTNLYSDEILPATQLPIKMTAHTPCFRKEAGSAGRDTRGIIRQHQFHKVELVAITTPQESDAMLDEMVACASDLLTSLGLHHRLVMLCGGDLGFSAAKTIDIEVWLPGQNAYREISSISNTRDFQARRAKIRYKSETGNQLVHTLNGSSLAVGRTLVAIMENYQDAQGNIALPEALKSYL
ncbi:MAG: seryl-tRNA synthetase [Sulfurovum sp. PC08-66]|nr:MAG: seryl-tRNA synthetase [Sulfurovum sp. PC08-66]KIM12410.1 MAG: seryl-tRNA synthetase [Sulfuricurvum sp. PC08-66]